jgi:hypothetical protein
MKTSALVAMDAAVAHAVPVVVASGVVAVVPIGHKQRRALYLALSQIRFLRILLQNSSLKLTRTLPFRAFSPKWPTRVSPRSSESFCHNGSKELVKRPIQLDGRRPKPRRLIGELQSSNVSRSKQRWRSERRTLLSSPAQSSDSASERNALPDQLRLLLRIERPKEWETREGEKL